MRKCCARLDEEKDVFYGENTCFMQCLPFENGNGRVYFPEICGIMRLALSLACKGESAERIACEACNMPGSYLDGFLNYTQYLEFNRIICGRKDTKGLDYI